MGARILRIVGRGLQLLLAAAVIAWVALALHFQIAMPARAALYGGLAAIAGMIVWFAVKRNWGRVWVAMIALVAVAAAWWATITPREDRIWRPEVARGVTSDLNGDTAILKNVRDFNWITEDTATESWVTRTVDLTAITSLDVFLSVWDSPDIAHTLVSFGFADGQHVVFSSEIRKEAGEDFSSLGGFFKEFELVLIAAEERDIIRLRTDLRGEQVSVYPITLGPEARRTLFLSFLDLGNDLARAPRWYNTLTANCTTVPYHLARQLSDRVVLDPRVILSGRLPGYLYDLGILRPDMPLPAILTRARLGTLGPSIPDGAEFARRLRSNWSE